MVVVALSVVGFGAISFEAGVPGKAFANLVLLEGVSLLLPGVVGVLSLLS